MPTDLYLSFQQELECSLQAVTAERDYYKDLCEREKKIEKEVVSKENTSSLDSTKQIKELQLQIIELSDKNSQQRSEIERLTQELAYFRHHVSKEDERFKNKYHQELENHQGLVHRVFQQFQQEQQRAEYYRDSLRAAQSSVNASEPEHPSNQMMERAAVIQDQINKLGLNQT
jgi:predicted RNase H-like nuclease (RuvC/YqgF family)